MREVLLDLLRGKGRARERARGEVQGGSRGLCLMEVEMVRVVVDRLWFVLAIVIAVVSVFVVLVLVVVDATTLVV